jgi:methionine synthase II (cobalamin-independent)
MLENEDALAKTIGDLVGLVGSERLSVSPSAGLEFLPREKARAKLERLATVAKKVGA